MPIRLNLDKFLFLSVILALFFCTYGIHWGWSESWNPDQKVFADIFEKGRMPFQPKNYFKPAFHTYFTFFLSRAPIHIIGKIFDLSHTQVNTGILIWSRLITAFLFAGTVILSFMIVQKHFGLLAARATALLLGTSAGFIAFAHF